MKGHGEGVKRVEQDFIGVNIITAAVEHNGYHGGDAGHGGYVKIEIYCDTEMDINGEPSNELELILYGDSERENLISALKMIVAELEA